MAIQLGESYHEEIYLRLWTKLVIDPIKDNRFDIEYRGRQVEICALDLRIKKCETS